jgi:hypothetical protein
MFQLYWTLQLEYSNSSTISPTSIVQYKSRKSQQSNDSCTGQNPKLVKKGITIIMLQDFHNVEVEPKDSPTRGCRLLLLEELALKINYKKRALSNQ